MTSDPSSHLTRKRKGYDTFTAAVRLLNESSEPTCAGIATSYHHRDAYVSRTPGELGMLWSIVMLDVPAGPNRTRISASFAPVLIFPGRDHTESDRFYAGGVTDKASVTHD
jgi:hypothetical protein